MLCFLCLPGRDGPVWLVLAKRRALGMFSTSARMVRHVSGKEWRAVVTSGDHQSLLCVDSRGALEVWLWSGVCAGKPCFSCKHTNGVTRCCQETGELCCVAGGHEFSCTMLSIISPVRAMLSSVLCPWECARYVDAASSTRHFLVCRQRYYFSSLLTCSLALTLSWACARCLGRTSTELCT